MQHVYHIKPSNMAGTVLKPLNDLKEDLSDVYTEAVKKYAGREHLLDREIPPLNCRWNDVLHLSPINPQVMFDTAAKENIALREDNSEPIEVYRIPAERLPPAETVCFQSFNFEFGKFSEAKEKFWQFDLTEYSELETVPADQLKIWRKDISSGRRPFWYSHTMHVLSRTTIDISDCEILSCS